MRQIRNAGFVSGLTFVGSFKQLFKGDLPPCQFVVTPKHTKFISQSGHHELSSGAGCCK